MLGRLEVDQRTLEILDDILSRQQAARVDAPLLPILIWARLANDYISLRTFFQLICVSRSMRDLLLGLDNRHRVLRSQLTLFPVHSDEREFHYKSQFIANTLFPIALPAPSLQDNLQCIIHRIQVLQNQVPDSEHRKRIKSWLLFDDVKAAEMLRWDFAQRKEFLEATVVFPGSTAEMWEPDDGFMQSPITYDIFSFLSSHGLIVQLRYLIDFIIKSARQVDPGTTNLAALKPFLLKEKSYAFAEAVSNGHAPVVRLLLDYAEKGDLELLKGLMFCSNTSALLSANGYSEVTEVIVEVYKRTRESRRILFDGLAFYHAGAFVWIVGRGDLALLQNITTWAHQDNYNIAELLSLACKHICSNAVKSGNVAVVRWLLELARANDVLGNILRADYYMAFRRACDVGNAASLALLLQAALDVMPEELEKVLYVHNGSGFIEAARNCNIATIQLLYRYTEPGQPQHHLRARYEAILNDYPESRRQLELAQVASAPVRARP